MKEKQKKKSRYLGRIIAVLVMICCLSAIFYPSDSDKKETNIANTGTNILEISTEIEYQMDTLNQMNIEEIFVLSESKKEVLNGKNKYTYSDGSIYNGEFSNGKRNGNGKMTFADGSIYKGEWKKGYISGEGKYTFADGSILKGKFKKNKFLSGSYTYSNKKGTFVIYFENSKSTGKIKVTLKNGDTYKGKLKNGKFNGSCTIVYKDGDKYSGNVVNSLKSGKGTYTWSTGEHYTGQWSKDKMSGTGKYYYTSGKAPYLKGKFVKNKPSGTCVYYKTTKKKYNTYWKNGVCTKITK